MILIDFSTECLTSLICFYHWGGGGGEGDLEDRGGGTWRIGGGGLGG